MNLIGLALLLAFGLLLAAAALTAYTVHALTHPPRRTTAWAVARSLPADPGEVRTPGREAPAAYESWTFRSRGMDLPVWDIPGWRQAGPAVIFTHGWGDSRVIALSRLPPLLPICSRIILWDLPGHGQAPGTCSLGTREVDDLLALVQHLDDGSTPIILHGFSLGAGVSIVAAAVAAHHGCAARIRGVIAESPYRIPIVPARNVMHSAGIPAWLTLHAAMAFLGLRLGHGFQWAAGRHGGRFDRARHAANLTVPLLVLHGEGDAICPPEDGRAIAAAAGKLGSLVCIPGGDHTRMWTEPVTAPAAAQAVAAFIQGLPAAAVQPARAPVS